MKDYAALIRHDGNRHLFEAVEMSIIGQLWGEPLHLHAEGVRGTGKTTILRAARRILPRIERIRGCPYNCDPRAPHCPLHAHWTQEQIREHGTEWIPMPFREISPSAKVGTVTGSLDLTRLTDRSRPEAALLPGTLAQAHRGIVLVDEINRLADIAPDLVDCLLDVMGTKPGRLQIEETGLPPVELPVRVAVWAASNPDEEPGPLEEIRRQLSDRFDMVLDVRRPAERSLVKRILQLTHASAGGAAASVAGAALEPAHVAGPAAPARAQQPAAAEGSVSADQEGRTGQDEVEQDPRYRWREIAASRPAFPDSLFDLLAEVYVQFRLESLRAMEAWRQAATLYAARGRRSEVTCQDLLEVAPGVLRHRVEAGTLSEILEYLSREEEARAGGRDGRPAARAGAAVPPLAGSGEAGPAAGGPASPAGHPGAGGQPASEAATAGGAAALAAQAAAREGSGGVWSRLRDLLGRGTSSGAMPAMGAGQAGAAEGGDTVASPLRPGTAATTTPLRRARPLLELTRDRAIRSWQEN
ncbi:MAG TPA: AAA family ATPase [Thermaerobacter sp.]